MILGSALFRILVFPGALYAVPAAWLMVWIYRKLNARLQRRVGPPFLQPFFDFVKLLAKQRVARPGLQGAAMLALAIGAVASTLGAISLLPVASSGAGVVGDMVLLVALLEFAPLCGVLAGFVSRSLYGQIGSMREAVLGVVYSVPFMAALFAFSVSAGSLQLSAVVESVPPQVRIPALLALALCLPAKLRLNPFSIPNAEQEIYAGALTEFEGPVLALWELAHGLEWVALIGLWVTLAIPLSGVSPLAGGLLFVIVSFAIVPLLSLLASGTARLKLAQASRIYWTWGFGISAVSLIVATVLR